MPLDERALRKPTLDESASHPVRFGDAGTFLLPKPHVRLRFLFGEDGDIAGKYVVTDDPAFNALSRAIEENDTYADIGRMAAYLLRRNYDLTPDQLSEILEYGPSDDSPDRWPLMVMEVIYGRTGGNG